MLCLHLLPQRSPACPPSRCLHAVLPDTRPKRSGMLMLTKLPCGLTGEQCQGPIYSKLLNIDPFFYTINPSQLFITPQSVTTAAQSDTNGLAKGKFTILQKKLFKIFSACDRELVMLPSKSLSSKGSAATEYREEFFSLLLLCLSTR